VYQKKKIIIGFSLSDPVNQKAERGITRLILFINLFLRCDLLFLLPHNHLIPKFLSGYNVKYFKNDSSLFDFSRYSRIISSDTLSDEDILFAFNDTLGNGRKFNLGLQFFIYLSFAILFFNFPQKIHFCAPVDKDKDGIWISPYFFIGKIWFIKRLNFTNFRKLEALSNDSLKFKLQKWLKNGWRSSRITSLCKKRIKYRTLLLERSLISEEIIKKNVLRFSRSSFLRIINSFF